MFEKAHVRLSGGVHIEVIFRALPGVIFLPAAKVRLRRSGIIFAL